MGEKEGRGDASFICTVNICMTDHELKHQFCALNKVHTKVNRVMKRKWMMMSRVFQDMSAAGALQTETGSTYDIWLWQTVLWSYFMEFPLE